jgi:hypothetical protein
VLGDETRDAGDDANTVGTGNGKGIKTLAVHDVLPGSVDPGAETIVATIVSN